MRSYQFLKEKRGLGPGDIGHWVISPPQGFTKAMVQDDHHYMMLGRHIMDPLQSIGCKAESLIFHPWRQGPDYRYVQIEQSGLDHQEGACGC